MANASDIMRATDDNLWTRRATETAADFRARHPLWRADAGESFDDYRKRLESGPIGPVLDHAFRQDSGDEEGDEEQTALSAENERAAMVKRKKDGWKLSKKDRGKPPSEAGKEGEGALAEHEENLATSKSAFEARVNRRR